MAVSIRTRPPSAYCTLPVYGSLSNVDFPQAKKHSQRDSKNARLKTQASCEIECKDFSRNMATFNPVELAFVTDEIALPTAVTASTCSR